MKITVRKPQQERWLKLMKLGGKTGCHQILERSFSYHGYQFPVCARCTGVILGYIIAVIAFYKKVYNKRLSFAGCAIMFIDWTIQKIGLKESTNSRRVLTGIAGGFGIMSIQLEFLRKFKRRVCSKYS